MLICDRMPIITKYDDRIKYRTTASELDLKEFFRHHATSFIPHSDIALRGVEVDGNPIYRFGDPQITVLATISYIPLEEVDSNIFELGSERTETIRASVHSKKGMLLKSYVMKILSVDQ